MKKVYRALRYHDRLAISYVYMIVMAAFYVGMILWSFHTEYEQYKICATTYEWGFGSGEFVMGESLNSMYQAIAFAIPGLLVMLFTGVSWDSVLGADRLRGWNRVVKASPVSPATRAKSLLFEKWKVFGICAAVSLTIGFVCSMLTVGSDFAMRVVVAILVTLLIVGSITFFVDAVATVLVAHAPAAWSSGIVVATIVLTFVPIMGIYIFMFESLPYEGAGIPWTQYSSGYCFGPAWLVLIVIFAAVNVFAWFMLKHACARKE